MQKGFLNIFPLLNINYGILIITNSWSHKCISQISNCHIVSLCQHIYLSFLFFIIFIFVRWTVNNIQYLKICLIYTSFCISLNQDKKFSKIKKNKFYFSINNQSVERLHVGKTTGEKKIFYAINFVNRGNF